ncbi:unnamed protein product, partial [Closterium sp. Naga37s-1]
CSLIMHHPHSLCPFSQTPTDHASLYLSPHSCRLSPGGYQPNNARIDADSLANLSAKHLLPLQGPHAAS